jgi:hypothetical protein
MKKEWDKIEKRDLIKIRHIGDDGQHMYHPFLVLFTGEKRILTLQFSSINAEGESYFGDLSNAEMLELTKYHTNEIANKDKIILNNKNYLPYASIADPDVLHDFYYKQLPEQVEFESSLSIHDFNLIVKQIAKTGWEKNIQTLVDAMEEEE